MRIFRIFFPLDYTQQVAKENQQQVQEKIQREKELKAIKKAKRESNRLIRSIFKLIILGFLLYIYYLNQDLLNPMIREFISQFM